MDEVTRDAIDDVLTRAVERLRRVEADVQKNSAHAHELGVARKLIESAIAVIRVEQAAAQDGDAAYTSRATYQSLAVYNNDTTHQSDALALDHTVEFLPPIAPLTAREEEVLQLMARGLKNREIAQALTITERTAIFHVGNVIAKLGADSRVEAIHFARQRGLL
jgi:DNA-binding NarL/FixJ family response regulator